MQSDYQTHSSPTFASRFNEGVKWGGLVGVGTYFIGSVVSAAIVMLTAGLGADVEGVTDGITNEAVEVIDDAREHISATIVATGGGTIAGIAKMMDSESKAPRHNVSEVNHQSMTKQLNQPSPAL